MSFTFKAQVQYEDWEGTAAVDGHQGHDFEEFLRGKQLMQQSETLIAVSFRAIQGFVYVHSIVVDRNGYKSAKDLVQETDPIPVRRIELDLTLQEFFSHLKRFNAVLTWNTLDLTGRAYEENS